MVNPGSPALTAHSSRSPRTLPAMARYIVEAGKVTIRTPGGWHAENLWIGLEIDAPVNLKFLSRNGYDLVPADGFEPDELASVGVSRFERIET